MNAGPTRVCVASHHASLAALVADPEIRAFFAAHDGLVELRLDRVSDATVQSLQRCVQALGPQRCVVTCRAADEGGGSAMPEATRHALWEAAIDAKVAVVDIELATLRDTPGTGALVAAARAAGVCVCISFHDFSGVPPLERLRALRREAEALGADVVKLAVRPAVITDALPLLTLLGETCPGGKPLLGLAMGETGIWSRVLAACGAHPPPFTYARCDQAGGTAPGQPSWQTLLGLYRFAEITAQWPVYGVIGTPVAHSLSPLLHNQALRAAGLAGVYLPFRVDGDPLPFLAQMAPRLRVCGLSVTLPHKQTVRAACRALDPLAARLGAVNTLSAPQHGTYVGHNTDAAAATTTLRTALGSLHKARVLVLGAGGVARAVAHGVAAEGAAVLVANRNPTRAAELAREVGGTCVHLDTLAQLPQLDALVNATPVGMHPAIDETPLNAAALPAARVVFDTIYTPARTRLLTLAEQAGSAVVGGQAMFLAQAEAQFELFCGVPAPAGVVQEALLQA